MVLFRNDRQIHARSTIALVKYHLQSWNSFCVFPHRIACIHVSVEGGEIAAGDISLSGTRLLSAIIAARASCSVRSGSISSPGQMRQQRNASHLNSMPSAWMMPSLTEFVLDWFIRAKVD
jgi:hypothetical protein